MELARYKACICEGSAENAIMDILLDHNLLIFSREEMLEEEIIRCREGKKFEEKYNLPFTLLSDPELSCIQAYDVWKEKVNYGKKSMGVVRTSLSDR